MFVKVLITLFTILSVITSSGQQHQKDLNTFFTALSRNGRFNGNILVADKGKVVYEKSFGFAVFDSKTPNTRESRFAICSITKTFVATAILQLQDEGKLKVTDYVVKYLPAFPYPNITITHLLTHTSGIRRYDDLVDSLRVLHPDTVFTNQDMLPRYAELRLPLLFEPGTAVQYDNINFMFASVLVEKITGMRFAEYLESKIFIPAGLKNTFVPRNALYHWSGPERKNLSLLYFFPHPYSKALVKADTVASISRYWKSYNIGGEGEIISTEEDLLKYDQALYNGELVSAKSLIQAYTPYKLANGQYNGYFFGLGWIADPDSSMGKVVRYSGGAIGIQSHLLRNITRNQTVIIIDNTNNPVDAYAMEAMKILNGAIGRPQGKSLAKLYGTTLLEKGADEAKRQLVILKQDTLKYSLDENEFNNLGYDLMDGNATALLVDGPLPNHPKEALEVFKLNTELFPKSWNVYDSYGENLLKAGQKEQAIKMYKRSLELNPDNEGGKRALTTLEK